MLRQVAMFVARRSWTRRIAVSTPGVRQLAWRFVAGEDLEAGVSALRMINARGLKGTLNHVGTHVQTEFEAVSATEEAVDALRRLHAESLEPNISIKLSQLGIDIDQELCRSNLRRVLDCANDTSGFVRIDMEESPYTERTIELFEKMRDAYGSDRVGIVLQSYLRNRPGDMGQLLAGGSRIRLVKGGYWEPVEVAYRTKVEIDRAFRKDMKFLLENGQHPAIATHDPVAIRQACGIAARAGLDKRAFEFQMLYGVREDLQDSLVRDGYSVRSYVPYGGEWFAYVLGCIRRVPGGAVRRLAERRRPTLL